MNKELLQNVRAILAAGLSHQVLPDADLSQADWDALMPFLTRHHLAAITQDAFAFLKEQGAPLPSMAKQMKVRTLALNYEVNYLTDVNAARALAHLWHSEGKRPIALGGYAFASCYPNPKARGGNELICFPLYNADATNVKDVAPSTEDFNGIRLRVETAVVTPHSGKRGLRQDAIFQSAFFRARCIEDPTIGIAVPNLLFRSLYHVHYSFEQYLHDSLQVEAVIDWAMLLQVMDAVPEFPWKEIWENLDALGLRAFAEVFSALAVFLTQVHLSADATPFQVSQDEVDALLDDILKEGNGQRPEGRIARFRDVLNHKEKYQRFTELSPTLEAIRQLFS